MLLSKGYAYLCTHTNTTIPMIIPRVGTMTIKKGTIMKWIIPEMIDVMLRISFRMLTETMCLCGWCQYLIPIMATYI